MQRLFVVVLFRAAFPPKYDFFITTSGLWGLKRGICAGVALSRTLCKEISDSPVMEDETCLLQNKHTLRGLPNTIKFYEYFKQFQVAEPPLVLLSRPGDLSGASPALIKLSAGADLTKYLDAVMGSL